MASAAAAALQTLLDHLIATLPGTPAAIEETAEAIYDEVGQVLALHLAQALRARPEYRQLPDGVAYREFIYWIRRRAFGADHLAVAATLQEMADGLIVVGKPAEAAARLEQALAICLRRGESGPSTIACLIDLGAVRRDLADYDGARRSLARAFALMQGHADHHGAERVRAMGEFSALNLAVGRFGLARTWARRRLRTARQTGPEPAALIALALIDLAALNLLFEDGDTDALLEEAGRLLDSDGETPHPFAWAAVHGLGRVAMEGGRHGQALAVMRKASAMARQTFGEAHPHRRAVMRSLAELTLRYGPPVAVRPIAEDMLATRIGAVGPRHPDVAGLRVMLATVALRLGEAGPARRELDEALAIQEERLGEAHPAIAETLDLRAELAFAEARYAEARDMAERALAVRQRTFGPRHTHQARSLSILAGLCAALDQPAEGEPLQRQGLEILQARFGSLHPEVARAQSLLAAILLRAGKPEAARDEATLAHAARTQMLGSALGTPHAELARSHRDLGAILAALGAPGESADHYEKADALIRQAFGDTHPDRIPSLIGRAATVLGAGNPGQAEADIAAALAILAAHPHAEDEWQALALMATIAEAKGQPDLAIAFGKLAVNRLQSLRAELQGLEKELQEGFLVTRSEIYRKLADQLIGAGRLAEALQVVDMLKAAELREASRWQRDAGILQTSASLTPAERGWAERGEAIAARLSALTRQAEQVGDGVPFTQELRAEQDHFLARRAVAAQSLRNWLDETVEHDPAEAIRGTSWAPSTLPDDPSVTTLDYVVRGDHLAVVVSSPAGRTGCRIGIDEARLNGLVFDFWSAVRAQAPDVLRPARRLYDVLVAPVIDSLPPATSLRLSLDGALRYVPFAALHDGTAFLVERFALSHAARGLAPVAGRRPGQHDIAGFGVSTALSGLPALPFVRDELEGIVRTRTSRDGILPGTIHLDHAFDEASLAAALNGTSIVHIASHFMFLPAEDLGSWLLLGDGGRLGVERILSDQMPIAGVDLLGLSACDTAMVAGRRRQGGEVETLPGMLLAKGVRAVLASLWPVNDMSTARLMRRFYRGWRLDGLSKGEALRQAQLAQMRGETGPAGIRGVTLSGRRATPQVDLSHPYHWAAFQLSGEVG